MEKENKLPVAKKEEKKVEDKKAENKVDNKDVVIDTSQKQAVSKKEDKKAEKPKKEEAIARGLNLHASKKHCMYICSFIKNKPIDKAISELEEVIKLKKAIPFKGEIPHRHNPGMMSGRYPVKASKQIIYVLKALKGNSVVNGLDLEKVRIHFASASWASRPAKKGGMRFKRTNLILKAKEFPAPQEIKEAKKQ